MTFYERFESLCRSKGFKTQSDEIVAMTGVSSPSITGWKKGSAPRSDVLMRIASYFDVSVDYLLGIDNEPEPQIKKPAVRIPVFGSVAAGIPIEAITDVEDYEEIPSAMADVGEYFALRIHGDSMEPRMMNGDVVIVRKQDTVDTGDIAIVLVNGSDATCKRIKRTSEGVMLISLNPKYEPMFYNNDDITRLPIQILGKVVELRAKSF